MFDHPNEPQHLVDSLVAFVDQWHGIRPWYAIAPAKLNAVSLPKPLSRLYGSLGNMPGSDGRPFPFSSNDQLLPFELLRLEDARLLFAVENQGCWRAYTEAAGDDPHVWFRVDEDKPELEHPSLANFLVTLCLQELTMDCPALYAGEKLRKELESTGHRVNPLWLDGLFPGFDQLLKREFFLVDGRALLVDDHWIGFQTLEEADRYSDALQDATRIHPFEAETLSMSEYVLRPDRNPMLERIFYERLARDFQTQADEMQAKADVMQMKAEECQRAANRAMHGSGNA